MVRTKNVGGGLGDDDRRPPPRLPIEAKAKKLATRKRKYPDAKTARAATVAEAVDHAKRGGARSGVVTTDQQLPPAIVEALVQSERLRGGRPGTITVVGRRHVIGEGQHQGESQQ
jgi:hypothetical protein